MNTSINKVRRTGATLELFRPTGINELQLVVKAQLRAWPPRLPDQPIFYPVLNQPYAEQIARDWNTKAEPFAGYVTAFEVSDSYASKFERRVVGGHQHEELWVPAEELDEFNDHLEGPIRVLGAFFGESFRGLEGQVGGFKGRSAAAQLEVLAGQFEYNVQDFHGEITLNSELVFLHLPYWEQCGDQLGVTNTSVVLGAVREVWADAFPSLPLSEPAA